jgi:hypothetical protein
MLVYCVEGITSADTILLNELCVQQRGGLAPGILRQDGASLVEQRQQGAIFQQRHRSGDGRGVYTRPPTDTTLHVLPR